MKVFHEAIEIVVRSLREWELKDFVVKTRRVTE